MVKKRVRDMGDCVESSVKRSKEGEDSGSDEDVDFVNVDFEWFNMKPEVDFHGTKNLLRQLFDVDSQLLDLSALTSLILSQPTIGSTVKVDGDESDPYAFLTILNVQEHRENPVMMALIGYLVGRANSNKALSALPSLLNSSSAQVGLLLNERLINMPAEIAPPMYAMLIDEIESAVDDKEPYEFTHYLIISKRWFGIQSTLDDGEDAARQQTSKSWKDAPEMFFFHDEDETFHKYAVTFGDYEYFKDEGDAKADSKRAFQEVGIKAQGHAILIEATKYEEAVKAAVSYVNT